MPQEAAGVELVELMVPHGNMPHEQALTDQQLQESIEERGVCHRPQPEPLTEKAPQRTALVEAESFHGALLPFSGRSQSFIHDCGAANFLIALP
jgi:hypothetical protein